MSWNNNCPDCGNQNAHCTCKIEAMTNDNSAHGYTEGSEVPASSRLQPQTEKEKIDSEWKGYNDGVNEMREINERIIAERTELKEFLMGILTNMPTGYHIEIPEKMVKLLGL